jgi:hypothetical protein
LVASETNRTHRFCKAKLPPARVRLARATFPLAKRHLLRTFPCLPLPVTKTRFCVSFTILY